MADIRNLVDILYPVILRISRTWKGMRGRGVGVIFADFKPMKVPLTLFNLLLDNISLLYITICISMTTLLLVLL